ncbi:MAG TPA: MFS transporter [Acidobacteriota bacterium]|nr:MFS transporter [Acidobacteriota bacterium]
MFDSRPIRLIENALRIHPGEGRRTLILFFQLFAAGGIFVLGRTVRDTLFLSRYPIESLPWMYAFYGVAAALLSLLYGRYADRITRSALLFTTSGVGILSYLAVWLLVQADVGWIYPAFYIWAEVAANLFVLQFWTLAADLAPPRDARRLNSTIGAGRPLGTIFFGVATGWIVTRIGTAQLLFVLILLMVLYAACVYLLRHEPRYIGRQGPLPEAKGAKNKRSASETAYFRAISALILVMFITLTLGDYQFKVIAGAKYSEDDLARFFSLFYGIVGILSMGFQLFVTPRLLTRLGVGAALTVMPAVFGLSSVSLVIWTGLAAACVMKFSDNGLQYTLHDTTMQSLYAPFPAATRARTRGFLDGAIKPLSYGAGGLLLVLLRHLNLDVREMCLVSISCAVLWQVLVPLVRKGYLQSLERGLTGPMAAQLFEEPFTLGGAERKILIQTLNSPDPSRVALALEQLQTERSPEFRLALTKLLSRPEAPIRARAIQLLESMKDHERIPEFRAACGDANPMVRAAALAALTRFVANEDPGPMYPFMHDPSPDVRSAVLSGLIRYGGIEAVTRAGEDLLRLQESADSDERQEACTILAKLGRSAYLSLEKLLRDANPRVRRTALRAAGSTADPRHIPLMIEALYDPGSRQAAMLALTAVGEPAVSGIDQALSNPGLPRAVRLELPRTLSRIISDASFTVLANHQENPDSHIRLRVYAALGRLRASLGRAPIPVSELLPRVRREVLEACGNMRAWSQARSRFETRLLAEEFEFRVRRAERRILRLLEMTYPLKDVSVILAALDNPERRSGALEALDEIVHPSLRELIIPLLEDRSEPSSLPLSSETALCILPPVEFMLLEAHHPNPYVAFLALDSLAAASETTAIPAAGQALAHPDPLVREAGLRALVRLKSDGICEKAAAMLQDPDPTVARWANHVCCRQTPQTLSYPRLDQETNMYGTIEKILLLKATPLFSALSGEDVAPLARVAETAVYAKDELIVKEGEPSDHFYVVVSGQVVREGRGREIRRVGPNETFGELAVLDRKPQTVSARALDRTELLRIGAEEFFEILHEQPEIAEGLISILAGQLRDAQIRLLTQA